MVFCNQLILLDAMYIEAAKGCPGLVWNDLRMRAVGIATFLLRIGELYIRVPTPAESLEDGVRFRIRVEPAGCNLELRVCIPENGYLQPPSQSMCMCDVVRRGRDP